MTATWPPQEALDYALTALVDDFVLKGVSRTHIVGALTMKVHELGLEEYGIRKGVDHEDFAGPDPDDKEVTDADRD